MWRRHLSFCFHRQTILLDLKHMYTIKILRTVCVLNCLVLYLVIVIFILLYPCHMWQQLLFTLCLNLSCIPVFDLVLTLILDCGLNLLLTLLHMNPHTSSTSRPLQYSNITFQLNDIICLSIFCTTYPRELGAQGRGHPGQGTLTHTYTQSNLPLRKDIIKQLRIRGLAQRPSHGGLVVQACEFMTFMSGESHHYPFPHMYENKVYWNILNHTKGQREDLVSEFWPGLFKFYFILFLPKQI